MNDNLTGRVNLVHDYLTQRGGAERVVLRLMEALGVRQVHTSFFDASGTFPEFQHMDVRTFAPRPLRFLRRDPRFALPLLAHIFEHQTLGSELTLCSSSGWSHLVQTKGKKLVYCHNPPRWLYQPNDYFSNCIAKKSLHWSLGRRLERHDRRAAATADAYIANSSVVRDRIWNAYHIEAPIIFPPPGLDRSGPVKRLPGLEPGFLLTVGRPRTYKNTDLICEAVEETPRLRLVVVGGLPLRTTPWSDRLRGYTSVPDDQLRWLYANSSAVVAMSREDFGLTPIEGYNFGKPCLALRAGGFLDSVADGVTGRYVPHETVASLKKVLGSFHADQFSASDIKQYSNRFGLNRFRMQIRESVAQVLS